MNYWKDKLVLVTGGASFIGSHLCEELLKRKAFVTVADDLSSGKFENLYECSAYDEFKFEQGNLLDQEFREYVFMNKYDVMFHLAAVHGGRGYVDRQQALISSNFALDSHCFMEARDVGVKKIVYASSGCVYPNFLQEHASQELYLKESLVPPVGQGSDVKTLMRMFEGQFTFMGYDADGIYGYAKLMAEFTLQAYHKAYGIETASCRYFTAYGPRAKEDHAVMAMIARAFSQQKPFEIWGDGTQIRNWTYIDDIVFGTLLVAEEVTDGRGVNVGTMERTSVKQAADFICRYMDVAMSAEYAPEFKFLLDMPTGPMNRVASNELIKSLGYGDFAPFHEGIIKTIAWYMKTKTPEEAAWLLKDGKLIDGLKR